MYQNLREYCHNHGLLLNFLCAFRSTTIIEMLSLLPLWRARFARYSAASCAAGSTPWPLFVNGLDPFFLCHIRRRFRATSHTSSFDNTSHNPSLATTRHSSSLARGMNMTSGSGMIDGFKYRSPEQVLRKQFARNHKIGVSSLNKGSV